MVAGVLAFFLLTTSFCFSQESSSAVWWPREAETPDSFWQQISVCCKSKLMSEDERKTIEMLYRGLGLVLEKWGALKAEERLVVEGISNAVMAPAFKKVIASARSKRWGLTVSLAGYLADDSLTAYLADEIAYCIPQQDQARGLLVWLEEIRKLADAAASACLQQASVHEAEAAAAVMESARISASRMLCADVDRLQ